jgi:hypothetical protein
MTMDFALAAVMARAESRALTENIARQTLIAPTSKKSAEKSRSLGFARLRQAGAG